jgi:hypothetical protein
VRGVAMSTSDDLEARVARLEAHDLQARVSRLEESEARTLGANEAAWYLRRGRFLRILGERGDATSQRLYEAERCDKRIFDAEHPGAQAARPGGYEQTTVPRR